MPTFSHIANGTKTVFKCQSSALPKFVRVAGVVVTPQSTNATSVTFASPPNAGATVEIMYGPDHPVVNLFVVGTAGPNDASTGVGSSSGKYMEPQAEALGIRGSNPAEYLAPPVVRYHGDLAENVTFTLDPAWAEVDVMNDGRVIASRR